MHDTTFEVHYSIADLAKRRRLGRETVRLLVKDEPGVIRVRLGPRRAQVCSAPLTSTGASLFGLGP